MDKWEPMTAVEPLKREAELHCIQWYYVDSQSGERRGPVPSRYEPVVLSVFTSVFFNIMKLLQPNNTFP